MKTFGKNNLKILFKKYWRQILLFACLSILNIIFLCLNFRNRSLNLGITFTILLIGSILLEVILCSVIIVAKRKKLPVEKLFLILGLIIGSFYILAIPIGRVPDEESHFFRIYEIASGHLVSDVSEKNATGSFEPNDITIVRDISKKNTTYHDLLNNLGDQADEDESFITTSAYGYNIISYLPQVTGMFIGKTLGFPYLICGYLAKFLNLIFCLLILYFSIKYIPFFKEIIFFIAFLPITMQTLVSLSADSLILVSSIALISFVLYSTYTLKTVFTKKHFLILLPICIFLSITKIVYAPLCLLLFAIPKERFGKIKHKLFWIFGLASIVIIAYLIWHFITPPIHSRSDPNLQISSILQNPFYYIAILVNSISVNYMLYLSGSFGGFLEWFSVDISLIYIIPSFIIFVLLCSKARKSHQITKSIKYLSIFLLVLISFLIFTALYITWTKAGETVIDGVQGRYFLPLMLLVPIICLPILKTSVSTNSKSQPKKSSRSNLCNNNQQNYYLYAFFIFESIYVITTIVSSHL